MIAKDRAWNNIYGVERIGERARAGDGMAQKLIGIFLVQGDVGVRNVEEGIVWLKRAADNGQAVDAAYWIGRLYKYGNGVRRDPVEAARWFERSFEAGSACAAKDLAWLHLDEANATV